MDCCPLAMVRLTASPRQRRLDEHHECRDMYLYRSSSILAVLSPATDRDRLVVQKVVSGRHVPRAYQNMCPQCLLPRGQQCFLPSSRSVVKHRSDRAEKCVQYIEMVFSKASRLLLLISQLLASRPSICCVKASKLDATEFKRDQGITY